jgi:hypothetical protein
MPFISFGVIKGSQFHANGWHTLVLFGRIQNRRPAGCRDSQLAPIARFDLTVSQQQRYIVRNMNVWSFRKDEARPDSLYRQHLDKEEYSNEIEMGIGIRNGSYL